MVNPFIYFPTFPDEQLILMYPIPGIIDILPNMYIITNYGRVLSLFNPNQVIELKYNNIKGYLHVGLLSNKRYRQSFRINRLVMIYFNFRPDCNELMVNHKNGVKTDNHLSNLEWINNRDNQIHAIRVLGTVKASLDNETVNKIRHELKYGIASYAEIALKYNTTYNIVKSIATNESYDFIPEDNTIDKQIYEDAKLIPKNIVLQIYEECRHVLDDNHTAELFNVPVRTVEAIRTIHPAYSHILSGKKPIKKDRRSLPDVPEDIAIKIYNERLIGVPAKELSIKYQIGQTTIFNICHCTGPYEYLNFKYGLEPIHRRETINISEEEAIKAYNLCLTKCNKEVTDITGILSDRLIDIKQCRGKFEYLKTKYGLEPQELYHKVTAKYVKK